MAPPKVRFLTKIYHPNIGTLLWLIAQTNSVVSVSISSKVRLPPC